MPFKLGHYWLLLPFSVSLWATNRLLLVAGLGPGPDVASGAVLNTGGGVSHLLMIAGPQVVSIRPISVVSELVFLTLQAIPRFISLLMRYWTVFLSRFSSYEGCQIPSVTWALALAFGFSNVWAMFWASTRPTAFLFVFSFGRRMRLLLLSVNANHSAHTHADADGLCLTLYPRIALSLCPHCREAEDE